MRMSVSGKDGEKRIAGIAKALRGEGFRDFERN